MELEACENSQIRVEEIKSENRKDENSHMLPSLLVSCGISGKRNFFGIIGGIKMEILVLQDLTYNFMQCIVL